jgi:ribosomal protein S18 acetylase RimI-like enzyme
VIIGTIDRNRGIVYRLLVEELYQRQGIGRALTTAMLQIFESRKVNDTWITADELNEPLLSFYRALGFGETNFFKTTNRLSIVAN